ncbi:IS1 family transposase [Chroococcidiopsis sp. CCMEE 29]|nr:IS1 family transposase [Chroococcidiopsis sp. CCMEE 29]
MARKTICFSKSQLMHDTVIGLFINRFEFAHILHQVSKDGRKGRETH